MKMQQKHEIISIKRPLLIRVLLIKQSARVTVIHAKHMQQQQQQQHSLFSQASWSRLEMKPERNKFKVHAH